jgi:regulator of sirC expression with transglutaminase-like and TPR domain
MVSNSNIKEIEALVRLIDDPDSMVYSSVKGRLQDIGFEAVPYLNDARHFFPDPFVQERIDTVIKSINFEDVKASLVRDFEQGCRDLLSSWVTLSSLIYPEIDEDKIRVDIARIRSDIWVELNDNLTALEQVKVFNRIFFEKHRFAANHDNYHSPQNSFVNTVLEARKGNPLSLSMVYMIVAQSLDMPVFGVNLPEHFVLAYTGRAFDPITLKMEDNKVLFYINPFGQGQLFSTQGVDKFIKQLKLEPAPKFFTPCDNNTMMLRAINNLVMAYSFSGEAENQKDMESLRDFLEAKLLG